MSFKNALAGMNSGQIVLDLARIAENRSNYKGAYEATSWQAYSVDY